jgi:hypothetical protein
MKPWALRGILIIVAVGIVLSLAFGSALPVVLAVCLSGLLAAGEMRARR